MLRESALMPEKEPADLIGRRLHIKGHADALLLQARRLGQLQNNGGGEIPISLILGLVIFTDINHSPQVLDQASVGIIRCRLVKKAPAVRIGVQNDLHGIDHSGFSASGMSGEKVDAFIQAKHLMINVMPVIQNDPADRLECLIVILHLPSLLPVRRPVLRPAHPARFPFLLRPNPLVPAALPPRRTSPEAAAHPLA